MSKKCLQEIYAPDSLCFGCGPANHNGLQLQSYVQNGVIIAHYSPSIYHHALPNVLNSGIISTLLDCHCNWAAKWALMKELSLSRPPQTVTAEYQLKCHKPVPMDRPLTLIASVTSLNNKYAMIESKLIANQIMCSTLQGKFVKVTEHYPEHH